MKHIITFLLFCLFSITAKYAVAQDATAPQPSQPPAQESNPPGVVTQAPAEAEETEQPGLFGGADLYYGGSNLPGFRRFHDGFWAAGSGLAYPSNVYLRYNSQSGAQAKVAIALSQLYNGS